MTHAESQDLLLDLAYGELDAARAAELQSHLSGCDECRAEKAALDEARQVAAPFRELEEPSPGFDGRILAAAKAQAQLEHEGNIGQVIEVSGKVKPLGIEAARIDAHAPVEAREPRRRPRWMLRATLAGSVAAAAALALVVSTTLQQSRPQVQAQRDFEIRVQPAAPPPAQVPVSFGEATNKAVAGQTQPSAEEAKQRVAQAEPQRPPPAVQREKKAAKRKEAPLAALGGSGGDSADSFKDLDSTAGRRASAGSGSVAPPAANARKAADDKTAHFDKLAAPAGTPVAANEEAGPSAPAKSEPARPAMRALEATPRAAAAPQAAAVSKVAAESPAAAKMLARADAQVPESLERRAQDARHAGNYALAAALYRKAAELHRDDPTPNTAQAAWDLAHAVECLAALGQFDEAKRVRDQMIKAYPSEDTAFYAAARALRAVEPVSPQLPAKQSTDTGANVEKK